MNLDVPYGITRELPGVSPEEARGRVTAALSAEGFGVLTEIDLGATLKSKLGVDVGPYTILGACNPRLAHRAVSVEPGVGLLIPCNVVVAAGKRGAVISAVSPRAMFGAMGAAGEELTAVASEAEERLRRAVAAA